MSNRYKIVDDFQAGDTDVRVLELNRDFDFSPTVKRGVAIIDGEEYPFNSNSVRRWITIKSRDSFKGKTIELV